MKCHKKLHLFFGTIRSKRHPVRRPWPQNRGTDFSQSPLTPKRRPYSAFRDRQNGRRKGTRTVEFWSQFGALNRRPWAQKQGADRQSTHVDLISAALFGGLGRITRAHNWRYFDFLIKTTTLNCDTIYMRL